MAYKNMEKSVSRENPPYLTSTFRKLVLVVLNIYNTVHNYNIKKSGTIGNHHRKRGHIGTPNPNEYMGCVCGRNPKTSWLLVLHPTFHLLCFTSFHKSSMQMFAFILTFLFGKPAVQNGKVVKIPGWARK